MNTNNVVILTGYLGKDPEVRTINDTTPVANVSLATSENYKDKTGEWQSITQWHNLTLWRSQAEYAQRNLKKGDLVQVIGKITYRNYEKEGEKRTATDIVVESVSRLTKRDTEFINQGDPSNLPEKPADASPEDEITDDLPF